MPRGERRVESGQLELLEGFEFNESSGLHNRLLRPFRLIHPEGSGDWRLELDAFIPDCALDAPKITSCFGFLFAVTALDLQEQEFKTDFIQSDEIFYDSQVHDPVSLELNIPAANGQVVLALAGVRFYECMDGVQYPLDKGKYQCAAIVKAMNIE